MSVRAMFGQDRYDYTITQVCLWSPSKFGRDLQDMKASSEGGGSNASQMVRCKHPYAKNSFQSTGLENVVHLQSFLLLRISDY